MVSSALGAKRKSKPIENWEQAVGAFSGIMGGKGVVADGKNFDGKDHLKGLDDVFQKIEEREKNEQRTD